MDLRWLSPLPKEAILREINKAKRVLIVDEGRQSGSVSEGLMTLLMELTYINTLNKTLKKIKKTLLNPLLLLPIKKGLPTIL